MAGIIARHAIQGYTNSLIPRGLRHRARVIPLLMARTVMSVLHAAISVVHLRIALEQQANRK